MDETQKAFLLARQKKFCNTYEQGQELVDKIKGLVDFKTIFCSRDETPEHIKNLIENGTIMNFEIVHNPMIIGLCHRNSAKYYVNKQNPNLKICCGYVLGIDDPIWRQHTWIFDEKNQQIIETCISCSKYFGITLNHPKSILFAISEGVIKNEKFAMQLFDKFINE